MVIAGMIVVDGMTVVVIMAIVMVEMMAVMGMMVVEVKRLGLMVGVVVIAVMGSYGGGTCDGFLHCCLLLVMAHKFSVSHEQHSCLGSKSAGKKKSVVLRKVLWRTTRGQACLAGHKLCCAVGEVGHCK